MSKKRIFVSGGAGVIGREIVPILLNKGYEVMVGDLKDRPDIFEDNVKYLKMDLNKANKSIFEIFQPNIFIHLAATFERSTETFDFWDENFVHNIRLSNHLMSILKDCESLDRVVFASSYLIYNQDKYQFDSSRSEPVCLNEADTIMPRNLTGMAKLAHEIELNFLSNFRKEQISFVSARIFRGYGRNSRDVISRWIRSLLKAEPIEVYNKEGIFDYIYAKDSAMGLVCLAENNNVTGPINLGTGRSKKVSDIIDVLRFHFPSMIATESGSKIRYEASQADMSHWQSHFDWLPEYTIDNAIPEMIEFEKVNLKIKDLKFYAKNVLISSASAKIPLFDKFAESAKKLNLNSKVFVGDLDPSCVAASYCEDFIELPRLEEDNLKGLISVLKSNAIDIILPTRDGELSFFGKYCDEFRANNIEILISSQSAINNCLDKLQFSHFGKENDLPFIPSYENIDDCIGKSYVVKERFGAGSEKIGIDLDKDAAKKHAMILDDPIYQPFITGKEFSADAWLNQKSEVIGIVLRHRTKVVLGESQITQTFSDNHVDCVLKHMLSKLQLKGHVVVQGFIDDQNNLYIIECNPRFGGASVCSIEVGLDSFTWSLMEADGHEIKPAFFNRNPYEVEQIRYKKDLYRWS